MCKSPKFFHQMEAAIFGLRNVAMVAIPVAHDLSIGSGDKPRIGDHKGAPRRAVQLIETVVDAADDLDDVFTDQAHEKWDHPFALFAQKPFNSSLSDKAVMMP